MICVAVSDVDVYVVPLITMKHFSDKSCTLDVGDHEFIVRASCVDYSLGKKCSLKLIQTEIASGRHKQMSDLSPSITLRVLDGLVQSDETLPWFLNECKRQKLTVFMEGLRKYLNKP